MNHNLNFVKMVGTGNDFIMIDNRLKTFPVSNINLIVKLCDRRNGVGSDGIILIEDSSINDFKMRIINPDGSEVDMCGNGARCAVKFAEKLQIVQGECTIETLAGNLKAMIHKDSIKINMGYPKDFRDNIKVEFNSHNYDIHFINTGVPHAVIFVDDIDEIDVYNFGFFIRHHDIFKPSGTNCNFVQIEDKHNIKVRTYERGVENETFSCGTGTCASAIVSVLKKSCKWPIKSRTPLNEYLTIDSSISVNNLNEHFYLEGLVKETFAGKIVL